MKFLYRKKTLIICVVFPMLFLYAFSRGFNTVVPSKNKFINDIEEIYLIHGTYSKNFLGMGFNSDYLKYWLLIKEENSYVWRYYLATKLVIIDDESIKRGLYLKKCVNKSYFNECKEYNFVNYPKEKIIKILLNDKPTK